MRIDCACGAPFSSPFTWIWTSAVVPVTDIQDAPLPDTRFAATGLSAAWYDQMSAAADAGPGRSRQTPTATVATPVSRVFRIVAPLLAARRQGPPSCPRPDQDGAESRCRPTETRIAGAQGGDRR